MSTQQLIQIILKTVLILLLFFIGQTAKAQYFVKSYDFPPFTTRTDISRSIEHDITSGWSNAGYSNSTPNAGGFDWMLFRLDNSGFVKGTAFLGFNGNDTCYSHIQLGTARRDYVLAGSYYDVVSGKNKASFSILDTNCSHLISKQISDTLGHTYRQVAVDPSNKFTLVGYIEDKMSPGPIPQNKVLAAQYSPTGILIWAYWYFSPSGSSTDEAFSICYQPTDNSYAITGRTDSSSLGPNFNVLVIKLNAAGIPIWSKSYRHVITGPGVNYNSRRIIPMLDGGFVIIGWAKAGEISDRNIWVFRINSLGLPIWSATYGSPLIIEEGHSIILSSDGTLVFTGFTNALGTEDILSVKIPAMPPLVPIWVRIFDRVTLSDRGYDLEEVFSPAGYIFTGQVLPTISSSLDPFLMRTDNIGNVAPGCVDSITLLSGAPEVYYRSLLLYPEPVSDTIIHPTKINPTPVVRNLCIMSNVTGNQSNTPIEYKLKQNYPNPYNPTTNIEFSIPIDGFITLEIYDVAGRKIDYLINEFKKRGSYIVSFNVSDLPSGVYFYRLMVGDPESSSGQIFVDVKRMVLIK